MMQTLSLQERRQLQGINYQLTNSSLTTGSEWYKDFESITDLKKYLPLDGAIITNNSAEDISFYPNDDTRFKKSILAGTIVTLDKATIRGLVRFRIVNNGSGTIAAGEVEVVLFREPPTTQRLIDVIAKKLPRIFTG